MSIDLPRLAHPGPRAPDRRQAVAATLRPIKGQLRAGRPVMDEVARLFADHGARGGMLSLEGVVCDPMRLVLPALATDAAHAAFYMGLVPLRRHQLFAVLWRLRSHKPGLSLGNCLRPRLNSSINASGLPLGLPLAHPLWPL
jgi:hypothetical protein